MSKTGRGSDQYMVRFPDGMREKIKAAADSSGRTMNAEIVATLEDGGLSKRDLIAAHALTGMLAHGTRYKPRSGAPANWHQAIAEEAYQIADAMLVVGSNEP
jgi:hypothetical protein